MKKLMLIAASALLSTPGISQTWVRYDILGSGSYDYSECCDDDGMPSWESGHLAFSFTAYVEVDPIDPDASTPFSYYADGQHYSGENLHDEGTWNDAGAANDHLSLSQYNGYDRGYVDISMDLIFRPGAFGDALPTSFLKPLKSGSFNLVLGGHYTTLEGGGTIQRATATVVSGPAAWHYGAWTSPISAPEPTSWAMMLAGFGLVGGAMRTRNKRLSVAT